MTALPSAQSQILDRLAARFDPQGGGTFAKYRDDWVACIEAEFGAHLTDDIRTVVESVQNNPITLVRSANGVGKTHGGAHLALAFYKIFDKAKVYTCAAPPENNLKNLLWGELSSITSGRPAMFEEDVIHQLHIRRNTYKNSFVTGVTIPLSGSAQQREARFSGKHAPYLLFMVDEGDAVPDEVYKGIESCMSGGMARLVIFFNPRERIGRVWELEHSGLANVLEISALSHPNVIAGRQLIPGAVTREKTVERFNLWTRPVMDGESPKEELTVQVPNFLVGTTAPTPSGGGFFPPLSNEPRIVTDNSFWYMVLAQYPPEGESRLISQIVIERAVARMKAWIAENKDQIPIEHAPHMGVDVSDLGQDSTVVCIRWGGLPKFFTWEGVEPNQSAEKAAELYKRYHVRRANVDALGVGAGVPARMTQLGCQNVVGVRVSERSTRYNPMGVFNTRRDELWWGLREWLRTDPNAMLPDDKDLLKQLSTPTYIVRGGSERGGRIMVSSKDDMRRRLGGKSPDKAEALMLTLGYKMTQFDSI